MSITTAPDSRPCPECGALNPPTAANCWLCYEPLDPNAVSQPAPPAGTVPLSPAQASRVLMARVTGGLLAVLVLLIAAGFLTLGDVAERVLGLGFLVCATPALVFTFRTGARRDRAVRTLGFGQVIGVVLASVGVTALVGVSSLITFFVVCFPTGLAALSLESKSDDFAIVVGVVLGFLAAGAVAYLVLWLFFRSRRPARPPDRT